MVLQREPHPGLAARSTTELRELQQIPYRIDLAGGWLDQPYVSEHYPGSVITLSIGADRGVQRPQRNGDQHAAHGA